MFRYHTLDDYNFEGKVVGVRVDINSPIINEQVVLNERIVASSKTLKELASKGAKVVVLAHQGRKGQDDCISLEAHSKLIEKEVKKKVQFINEIYSKNVEDKIKSLINGDILLLENLRFNDDENEPKKKGNTILKLESLLDFYVIDAFSVAHREQTSMIGFSKIPLLAGRVMQKELEGLNQISDVKRPSLYMLGGAKPDDLIEILEINFKRDLIDYACLSGVIGEIGLMIKGFDLGCKKKFLEEKDYLTSVDRIKKLIEKYDDKIILPLDLALFDGKERIEIDVRDLKNEKKLLDKFMVQDIGKKTVQKFKHYIEISGSIYLKGPCGNFEDKNFEFGSKEVISTLGNSKAFTYMGGGHSVTALEKYTKIENFSYVSLAGGALVIFLSGKNLPGVEALEKSFVRYDKQYEDFVVIGSNVIDLDVQAPISLSDFNLGDKVKVEEDFKQTVGGGGVNVSICLARLGAKVAYLGKISGESEDKVRDVLMRDKVDLVKSKVTKKPCAKSIIVDTKDNDRIIFTFRGQNAFLEMNDFDLSKIEASNFYLTSLSGLSFKTQIEVAKEVKKKNKKSNICLNLSFNLIRNEKDLDLLIKNCDVLVLNLEEAQEYSGKESLSDCLKSIKKKCSVVVITDGGNGAYAYDGVEEYFVPSFKPKKIVDTTGAGDCFAGTFFYFYVKGFGIRRSLEMAAKNSSSVVEYKGAQAGLKHYEDLV